MPEPELDRMFKSACGFLQSVHDSCSPTQLLNFYGLYKQSTVGDIEKNFLSTWFSLDPKVRAWAGLRKTPKSFAKIKYIEALEALDLGWTKTNYQNYGASSIDNGWGNRPSTMSGVVEKEVPESVFELFYNAVREGDENMVSFICHTDPEVAGKRDTFGGTAMHWASDANQAGLIPVLFRLGYRPNDTDCDNQTALHIAAICEYPECVAALLEIGANVYCEDSEGTSVLELLMTNENLSSLPKLIGLTYTGATPRRF